MSTRRPDEPPDKLDAALDGQPVEADDELAPLLETAAKLRVALEAIELDPETADRHLGMLLDEATKVLPRPTPPRLRPGRWRRRIAAAALAAALTVLPAGMASASALPGQAMYPVKLAVEQLRVTTVIWSSTREASERIKITRNRLYELDWLIQRNDGDRIPAAIVRLARAYMDARQAVQDAAGDTGGSGQAQALDAKLEAVTAGSSVAFRRLHDKIALGALSPGDSRAIAAAIGQPPVTPDLTKSALQPAVTTGASIVTTPTGPQTTQAPATTTLAPATTQAPPTTRAPTTTEAPTTTQQPTTTSAATDEGTSSEQPGSDDSLHVSGEETSTTLR
jgi:hypothetical protein